VRGGWLTEIYVHGSQIRCPEMLVCLGLKIYVHIPALNISVYFFVKPLLSATENNNHFKSTVCCLGLIPLAQASGTDQAATVSSCGLVARPWGVRGKSQPPIIYRIVRVWW
jgi:hypothetical protein